MIRKKLFPQNLINVSIVPLKSWLIWIAPIDSVVRNAMILVNSLCCCCCCCCSFAKFWPHEQFHARLPCLPLSPWVCSNLTSTELVIPSNHFILCRHLLFSPLIFPRIWVLSSELALRIRWPKYWSFSSSISPSHEYSEFISFRVDWVDLFAVSGTLKSLLQHHSLKASILQRSAFLMVQLSHLHMTTGKTIALTMWTFLSKVMSLFFNILSRFVMAIIPRSKCLF